MSSATCRQVWSMPNARTASTSPTVPPALPSAETPFARCGWWILRGAGAGDDDPQGQRSRVSLGVRLDDALAAHGHRVALRVDDRAWTYAEFGQEVDRVSAALSDLGVRRGSVVGLSAGNSVEFAAVVVAALRLGAPIAMAPTPCPTKIVSTRL